MKIVLCIAALLLCGFYLSKYAFDRPPLRGMGQEGTADMPVLVSRARPVVTFAPAKDISLTDAGWCSLSPETRLSVPGNGRLWFTAYKNDVGLLITALAEAESPWLWEAAHHHPFPVLRVGTIPYAGETLHETLYTLSADADPFQPLHDAAKNAPCLVYRAKLLLDFQQMQVIIEYHEPITQEQARDRGLRYRRVRRALQGSRAQVRRSQGKLCYRWPQCGLHPTRIRPLPARVCACRP